MCTCERETHTIKRMGSGFDVTGSIKGSFGFVFSVRKMLNTYMLATSFFFITFEFPSKFKALNKFKYISS